MCRWRLFQLLKRGLNELGEKVANFFIQAKLGLNVVWVSIGFTAALALKIHAWTNVDTCTLWDHCGVDLG